jgi:hypothetical protein
VEGFSYPPAAKCKKNIFVFKKISKSPEQFCAMFLLAARDDESVTPLDSRLEKSSPSLAGPLGFLMKYFFDRMVLTVPTT